MTGTNLKKICKCLDGKKMRVFKLDADNSKVLSRDLLEHLLEQFPLGHSTIHGEDHWMRVLYNGRMLARENRANLNVVELFAIIHDCQRDNDDYDLEHGRRAAEYVYEIRNRWLDINDRETELLVEACKYHSDGFVDADITIQTCWDSDRLDLGRVGIKPSPERLCTIIAKRSDVIEAAYRRSVNV